MSRAPSSPDPDLDLDLDARGARRRLAAAFPDLHPGELRPFAEGADFRLFEAGGTWLFRFPKRAGEVRRLRREVALLDRIADRLPVDVPSYEHRAADVAGYRRLVGHPLPERAPGPGFAASLAGFATALHGIDPGGAPLPGDGDLPGLAQARADVRDRLAAARSALPPDLHALCVARLDVPVPAETRLAPRLVHADLGAEHVLLDDGGSLRAVLDRGDARRGDPAVDLALAPFCGGAALLAATLELYGGEVDDGFERRARFAAACLAIDLVAHGGCTGRGADVRCGADALARLG